MDQLPEERKRMAKLVPNPDRKMAQRDAIICLWGLGLGIIIAISWSRLFNNSQGITLFLDGLGLVLITVSFILLWVKKQDGSK
jgi:hypothetical protein